MADAVAVTGVAANVAVTNVAAVVARDAGVCNMKANDDAIAVSSDAVGWLQSLRMIMYPMDSSQNNASTELCIVN